MMLTGLVISLIVINTAAFGVFLGALFYDVYLRELIES